MSRVFKKIYTPQTRGSSNAVYIIQYRPRWFSKLLLLLFASKWGHVMKKKWLVISHLKFGGPCQSRELSSQKSNFCGIVLSSYEISLNNLRRNFNQKFSWQSQAMSEFSSVLIYWKHFDISMKRFQLYVVKSCVFVEFLRLGANEGISNFLPLGLHL